MEDERWRVGIEQPIEWDRPAAELIGVRVAIGATPRAIARLVLAGSGSLLFDIGASDAATFLATAGRLASAAMLASYVPARRASRVDPLVSLRAE